MDNKLFQKKWHHRLLQVIFWVFFVFFLLLGIWGIFYEDDMPFIGFVWAGVLVIVYWIINTIYKRTYRK